MNLMALAGATALAMPQAFDIDKIAPRWTIEVDNGAIYDGVWWATLRDEALSAIIDKGLEGNPDLESAYGRLETAEGSTLVAFAPLLPSVSFDLTTNGQPAAVVFRCAVGPISPEEFASIGQDTGDPQGLCFTGSALFNFRWGLDVFGRSILNHKAARFEAQAARGDQSATRLMVSGTIASAYLDALAAAEQVTILQSQLKAQGELLEILELRYETGAATGLDVLQQRQTVASTRAALPPARLSAQSQIRVLAALCGARLAELPMLPNRLPEPVALPPIGTPQDLVMRRPDLAAARERVTAARARRSASIRALLPTLSANANLGWQYALADELSTLETWGIGGNLSMPLFNGGSGIGALRQATGRMRSTVSTYNTAILNAVRDVETGVVRDIEHSERHEAVRKQVDAARDAYEEAQQRYLQGIDTFLSVLTAQAGLQSAELSLVQAHRDRLAARVQLWTALGGGTGVIP
ncbi:MAG: efflux transporter outer membrane subunit [Myxococcota bacterium]